jgi:hypothetical protein
LYSNSFGSQRKKTLEDARELSIMLQFNRGGGTEAAPSNAQQPSPNTSEDEQPSSDYEEEAEI